MGLTKRDLRILILSCVAAHLIIGLVWLWSRQGFSWPITWTHRLQDDFHLFVTSSLRVLTILFVGWLCFKAGCYFDRGRTICRANRFWDVAFIAVAAVLFITAPFLAEALRHGGNYTPAVVLTFTVGWGVATGVGGVGAVILWFKGTRGAALLMVAYGVLSGTFFAWFLSMWLRSLPRLPG